VWRRLGGSGKGAALADWRYHEEEVGLGPATAPLEMLRACLLRATAWSVLVGALLGAGYITVMAVLRLSSGSRLPGGTLDFFVFASVLQGAITGLTVGVVGGLNMAMMALVSVAVRRQNRWYGPVWGIIGVVIAVLGAWGGRQMVGLPYPLLAAGSGDVIFGLTLAGLGGWWVGARVARWYVAETDGWERG
jgi:hypothetical protein